MKSTLLLGIGVARSLVSLVCSRSRMGAGDNDGVLETGTLDPTEAASKSSKKGSIPSACEPSIPVLLRGVDGC